MEKKHLVMSIVMMMAVGLGTGCKNESKDWDGKAFTNSKSLGDKIVLNEEERKSSSKDREEAFEAKTLLNAESDKLTDLQEDKAVIQVERDTLQDFLAMKADPVQMKNLLPKVSVMDAQILGLTNEIEKQKKIVSLREIIWEKEEGELFEEERSEIADLAVKSKNEYDRVLSIEMNESFKNNQINIEEQLSLIGDLDEKINKKSAEIDEWVASGRGDSEMVRALKAEVYERTEEKRLAFERLNHFRLSQEKFVEIMKKWDIREI